jgi:D-glycero-D-manno-heptose 1,7-bisphosphate phosphatase
MTEPADFGPRTAPAAVLFDRDGTLIVDVPANADVDRVRPMTGAGTAVARLRAAGLAVGVVTNQSAIGRGRLHGHEVEAINRRVDELLGPFDTWQVCPHTPEDGCSCRKPAPGLVTAAAAALGVPAPACVVIGDIGSDVAAAEAAGGWGILVPTAVTRPEEVAAAPFVAADLATAVHIVLQHLPAGVR